MNRIVERFNRLNHEHQKGFVVYIGAGDPNLDATRQLALAFDQLGVDVLELGVIISTDGSEARRSEVAGLGVKMYVEKPFRPEVMRDVLSELTPAAAGR